VAGVALGIFIGEYAADRLHDGGAREVFAGDHLQALGLAVLLGGDRRPDVGILELHEVGDRRLGVRCDAHENPPDPAGRGRTTLSDGHPATPVNESRIRASRIRTALLEHPSRSGEDFDDRHMPGNLRQSSVTRHERAPEGFRECDIAGVVGGAIRPQFPHAAE